MRVGGEFEQLGDKRLKSFYGNYNAFGKFDIFGRYDKFDEETYAIAGLSYELEKGLTIAPNIRLSDNVFEELKINFLFKF